MGGMTHKPSSGCPLCCPPTCRTQTPRRCRNPSQPQWQTRRGWPEQSNTTLTGLHAVLAGLYAVLMGLYVRHVLCDTASAPPIPTRRRQCSTKTLSRDSEFRRVPTTPDVGHATHGQRVPDHQLLPISEQRGEGVGLHAPKAGPTAYASVPLRHNCVLTSGFLASQPPRLLTVPKPHQQGGWGVTPVQYAGPTAKPLELGYNVRHAHLQRRFHFAGLLPGPPGKLFGDGLVHGVLLEVRQILRDRGRDGLGEEKGVPGGASCARTGPTHAPAKPSALRDRGANVSCGYSPSPQSTSETCPPARPTHYCSTLLPDSGPTTNAEEHIPWPVKALPPQQPRFLIASWGAPHKAPSLVDCSVHAEP